MSQENVEIVRAVYAAWSDHDLGALLEVNDPEVEFRTSGSFPDLEPIYRGHEGLRSFWDAVLAPWDSFQVDVERIVEGDECAAVAIRFRARGKGSGVLTDLRQGHVLRFKDGRIAKGSLHESFDEALEAAGCRSRSDLARGDRETFGTRMAAAGVPMRTLQEWLGHRDFKTTLIYADYAPSPGELELVERAFGAGTNSGTNLSPTEDNSDSLRVRERPQ